MIWCVEDAEWAFTAINDKAKVVVSCYWWPEQQLKWQSDKDNFSINIDKSEA